MNIDEIYIENFMSFPEARLDLTKYSGIVLIEGFNGSGKSTILDAVTWCLFGKLTRDTRSARADDVINRFSDGKAVVSLRLTLSDGRNIVVTRTRGSNGPSLRVTGINAEGTSRGIQESLERVIGFNYRTFVSSVVFGGSVSAFCSLTDAERKKILEEMLELDYFSSAQSIIADDLRSIQAEFDQAESELEGYRQVSADRNRALEDLRKSRDEYASKHEDRLIELDDDLTACAESLCDALSVWEAKRREYASLKSKYLSDKEVYVQSVTKVQSEIDELEPQLQELRSSKAVLSSRIAELESEIQDIISDKHPEICPTCGREWPIDNKSALEKAVNSKTEKKREAQAAKAKIDKTLLVVSEKMDSAEDSMRTIRLAEPKDPGTAWEYTRYERNNVSYEHERISTHARILRRTLAESKNPYDKNIRATEKLLTETQADIDRTKKVYKKKKMQIAHLEYWQEAFGRKGIPSYLIDSSIPIINENLAEITDVLTDGELSVYFDPEAVRGSSSVLGVDVEFAEGGGVYDMVSKGEHSRVDLAVLLAVSEILSTRSGEGCGQVWLDEVFDGLDEEGIESVARLLRTHFSDKTVFIISHDPLLKGCADHRIHVVKDDGESFIVGDKDA